MYAQAQVKARRRPDSGEVRNPGISYVAGAASGGTFAMPSLGHGRQGVAASIGGRSQQESALIKRQGAESVGLRPLPYRLAQNLRRQTGDRKEHTSELQSPCNLVCRLLLEKKKD